MKWFVLKRKIDGWFVGQSGNYVVMNRGDVVRRSFVGSLFGVALYKEKDVEDYAQLWGAVFEFIELNINEKGDWILP